MKAHLLLCGAAAVLMAVAPALGHPGGGGGGGGMMRGFSGTSTGNSFGSTHVHSFSSHQSFSHTSRTMRGSSAAHASTHSAALAANTRAANVLGNLNAAHASSMALQHASSHSMVGAIATYRTSMHNALALTNTTDQTNAIIAARQQLALRANKRLTPTAITRVDGLIGVNGADPTLGTTP